MRFIFIITLTIFCTSELHSSERLQILTEEWEPISYTENGRATGLAVEIVQEILTRLKMPDRIQIVPWARGWRTLLENPNVVLFTMTRTADREKLFTMIGPVAIGTTNFYARKGSGIIINHLDDAKQVKRIGVYRSAVEEQLLQKENFTNLEATSIPLQSARKLMAGRIDLWCNANLTAGRILVEAGYSFEDVENVFTLRENHLYIALSPGTSEEIINKWLEALQAIKRDGTFADIYARWLPGAEIPFQTERIGP